MSKEPTQFQFDCKVSLLALRDYLCKITYEEWREDMGWTQNLNYIDSWAEEQWASMKNNPFGWFIEICDDSQWKFLASMQKQVR